MLRSHVFPDGLTEAERHLFSQCLQQATPPGGERLLNPQCREVLPEYAVKLEDKGRASTLLSASGEDLHLAEVIGVLSGTPAREPIIGYQQRRVQQIDRALTKAQAAHENGTLETYRKRSVERVEDLEEEIRVEEKWLRQWKLWLDEAHEQVQAGNGKRKVGDGDVLLHGDLPAVAAVDGTHTWREVRDNLQDDCQEAENELQRKRRLRSLHQFRAEVADVFEEELRRYDDRTDMDEEYPQPHWSGLGEPHGAEESATEAIESTDPQVGNVEPPITGYQAPEYAVEVRDLLRASSTISSFTKLKAKMDRPSQVDTVKEGVGYEDLPREKKSFPIFKQMVIEKVAEMED